MLPALAICALLGIAAADRGWPDSAAVRPIGFVCGSLALLARRRPRVCAGCACGLAFALGANGLAERLEAARRDAPRDGFEAAVAARVCELSRRDEWISIDLCDGVATAFGELGAESSVPGRMRLVEPLASEAGEWLAALVPGDRVRVRLRIGPATGLSNPGRPSRVRALQRRGIGAIASVIDPALAVRVLPADAAQPTRPGLRARLAARMSAAGPGGALLAALAIGEPSGLAAPDREAFRRLGISHLLSVSGLHLALVGAMGFALVRVVLASAGLRADRWLPSLAARFDVRLVAAAGALLGALGYALLCGFGVPVQRSWVMLLVSLGVLVSRRRAGAAHALAAAALWIGAVDPAAGFELGPQLSFVATGALIAGLRRGAAGRSGRAAALRWPFDGLARALSDGLRVSAVAIAATAPVLALHGLPSMPIGLVANAIAVPLTGAVLLPASLAAAAVADFAARPAALVLAAAASVADLSLAAARAAAAMSPAADAIAPPAALAVLAAIGLALLCVRARHALGSAALAIAVCVGLQLAPRAAVVPAPPRIVMLDVGQGDSILVQARGAAVLVDGGWALPGGADLGRSVVVPALRALGVERLDVVAVTHADLDHRGGVPAVLDAFEVGELWVPAGAGAELDELLARARRRGVPISVRSAGAPRAQRGEIELDVLWPPAAGAESRPRNDRSLVLRVGLAGQRVLLAGDLGSAAEQDLLESGAAVRADLLLLPHHGSRGSSSPALLSAVGATIALVSAACSSRAHLPALETLERATRRGMQLGWTGRDGAILVALRRDSPAMLSRWATLPKCAGRSPGDSAGGVP